MYKIFNWTILLNIHVYTKIINSRSDLRYKLFKIIGKYENCMFSLLKLLPFMKNPHFNDNKKWKIWIIKKYSNYYLWFST